jgi:hypothetical protein
MTTTTFSRCGATWCGDRPCRCSAYHRTFAGGHAFDRHRSARGDHGTCLDPATVLDRAGRPIMRLRRGMWRGRAMETATRRRMRQRTSNVSM